MDELITQLRQLCEDVEDRASNAQEEAQQKKKEALKEVVQQIYRAVGLTQWFKKLESQFGISNVAEGDRVKFASSTLLDGALTWWNVYVCSITLDTAHATPWSDFKAMFIRKKLLKTLSLDESRSPEFNLFSDLEEYSEEEVAETMAETMEQYMSKTRADYGSGISRPKIEDKDSFELKCQILKELRDNTFSGSDHEDANEHIEKVLEIVDLFLIPNITQDQVMLRAFPMSLTGAASHCLRNKPSSSITTWEYLKTKFLSKCCPPARTEKKWRRSTTFSKNPMKPFIKHGRRFCSKGAMPSKTATDAKVVIQEMAEYSQKWHNGTSKTRSTETSDVLATIQAQLNNLEREIKKVDKKVYVAQVGCEARESERVARLATPKIAHSKKKRNNANPSYQERRQSMEDILSKFMSESAKRHEENSNMIKEIRASTDAAIRNQRASIKTIEIQIGQMRKSEEKKGSYGSQFSKANSYEASHINNSIPRKEKDPGSFTLPCYINNVCFDNALADLGASVSIMPLSTYLSLGLGELAHTKLTVELADRTVKYPKGIAKNVLVVVKNMDGYRDQDMEDKILGEPFCKASCVEARRCSPYGVILSLMRESETNLHRPHCKEIDEVGEVSRIYGNSCSLNPHGESTEQTSGEFLVLILLILPILAILSNNRTLYNSSGVRELER
ncbi:hypothetical protein Tco_0717476 [Tanacetum coccineum]